MTSVCDPSADVGPTGSSGGAWAAAAQQPVVMGSEVAGYVVENLASIGGFATVYRARAKSGRAVALKLLHPFLAMESGMILRFSQEAELISSIRHPNIVELIECGTFGTRHYLVMEWLEGRDLQAEIGARGAMSTAEVMAVMEPLAAALTATHALGIVHRDLKASNVMLVETPRTVKLVDFGLAKVFGGRQGTRAALTQTGTRPGTPEYMAPELILGQDIDARADVYAMGILLFQLLTGSLPFAAASLIEIEELHLSAPCPRASEAAHVPAALDEVIRRALAKDREDRHPSVDALLADLRRATTTRGPDEGSDARPRSRGETALGLYFEAGAQGDAEGCQEDAVLERLDATVDQAREAFARAGLDITLDQGTSFLAVARLPRDEHAEADERARITLAAVRLWNELSCPDQHGHKDPYVWCALTVHAGSVVLGAEGQAPYAGGDLLCMSDWKEDHRGCVVATAAALSGIEGKFVVLPSPDRSDRFWVLS